MEKIFRGLAHPYTLTFTFAVAILLLVAPTPWGIKWLALLLGVLSYVGITSAGRVEDGKHIAIVFFEGIASALVAATLVAVLAEKDSALHFSPEHVVVVVALAIVLGGISLYRKSADALHDSSEEMRDEIRQLKESNKTSESSVSKLDQIATDLQRTMGEANLVALAAQVLELKNEELRDPWVSKAVHAAIGSVQTWASAPRTSLDSEGVDARSEACRAGERIWWRCLESYHNEEHYDLARLELVTNSRNYTYILNALLQGARLEAELAPPDARDPAKPRRKRRKPRDLIVVQCSTFPPKDFYNFPAGSRGYRKYRDHEFYGTYRRSISFLNRQSGVFPHRVVFVSDSENIETIADLERMGWVLDPGSAVSAGSARLFCAPFSLPVSPDKSRTPLNFHEADWFAATVPAVKSRETGGKTVFQREQACPVVPYAGGGKGGVFAKWESQLQNFYTRELTHGSEYDKLESESPDRDKVDEALCRDPRDVALPNVMVHLRGQEAWSWDNIVVAAHNDLSESAGADAMKLKNAYEPLRKARADLSAILQNHQQELNCQALLELVPGMISTSQTFDAVAAELRARYFSKSVQWKREWMDQRSTAMLGMGPAEVWLFDALNAVNGLLFSNIAAPRKTLPIWDLFAWDFLGMGDVDIAAKNSRRWNGAEEAQAGVCSRVRFVPVRYTDDEEGVRDDGSISAHAFDRTLQREFTLLGFRKPDQRPGDGVELFDSVEWVLVLTCEMAPPFTTCRLNLHVDDVEKNDEGEVATYASWVRTVWERSADRTEQMFRNLVTEVESAEKAMETRSE